MTKAVDYGIVRLSLNGKTVGKDVDLYYGAVVPTGEVDLGPLDLPAGDARLTVEIVGANEKAVKSFMFGLDCLRLVPE